MVTMCASAMTIMTRHTKSNGRGRQQKGFSRLARAFFPSTATRPTPGKRGDEARQGDEKVERKINGHDRVPRQWLTARRTNSMFRAEFISAL